MKRFLIAIARKYPFLRNLYGSIAIPLYRRRAGKLSQQLALDPDNRVRQIAAAVKALDDVQAHQVEGWSDRIEVIRNELLSSDEPLVDGHFSGPGIYDGGSKTIKECCGVSKPPRAALFLYCLAKSLKTKRVLELGTNLGISASYLASGMKNNHEGGRLVTCESSPYRQRIAKQVHEKLGLNNIQYVLGLFSETLDRALEDCGEIDFAFIDGHHQYQPTLDYLNRIIPRAAAGCVILFDDIRWSDGMKQAWDEIRVDKRFCTVVDLETVGLCVLGPRSLEPTSAYGPVRIF